MTAPEDGYVRFEMPSLGVAVEACALLGKTLRRAVFVFIVVASGGKHADGKTCLRYPLSDGGANGTLFFCVSLEKNKM